jgi:hypothetical protein
MVAISAVGAACMLALKRSSGEAVWLTALIFYVLVEQFRHFARQVDFWLLLLALFGLHVYLLVKVVLPGTGLSFLQFVSLLLLEWFCFGLVIALALGAQNGPPQQKP